MLVISKKKILLSIIFLVVPFFANGAVIIGEIMYNLEGSDSGREWIEIFNNGSEEVDLDGWKLYEQETNHKINLVGDNESFLIPAESYAVLVDNSEKFLIDWPNFSGIIFDSVFSLHKDGEILTLRNSELVDVDSVSYSSEWGASGDGNSLQKISGEWGAGVPTPGAENSAEQQQEEESEPTPPSEAGSSGAIEWPTEQQIYANAGEDKVGVVGANITFSGQALGLEKKPLENARYLWSFGDGSKAEGESVSHFYEFPAEYIVVLNVGSGKYSSADNLSIKIVPNGIKITEADIKKIILKNSLSHNLDISAWFLRKGTSFFRIPESTIIKANSSLPISSSITKLQISAGENVDLLYPNGSVAQTFNSSNLEATPPIILNIGQENKVETLVLVGGNEAESSLEAKLPRTPSPSENLGSSNVSDGVTESENLEKNDIENTEQIANIISVAQPDSWGVGAWVSLILAIGIFGGAGLVFMNRKPQFRKTLELSAGESEVKSPRQGEIAFNADDQIFDIDGWDIEG